MNINNSFFVLFVHFLFVCFLCLTKQNVKKSVCRPFVQAKHLCFLIHIGDRGEAGATEHVFKPSGNVLADCFGAVLLLLILFVVCVSCLSLSYCLVCLCSLAVT